MPRQPIDPVAILSQSQIRPESLPLPLAPHTRSLVPKPATSLTRHAYLVDAPPPPPDDDERGVLVNQTRTRLSYCPCRLISSTLRRTKFLFISSSLSSPFKSGWVGELRCEPHQRC
jgi:hypothetical protein